MIPRSMLYRMAWHGSKGYSQRNKNSSRDQFDQMLS